VRWTRRQTYPEEEQSSTPPNIARFTHCPFFSVHSSPLPLELYYDSHELFAHALPFLDRPYFLAGTGVPDWLTVADRQVRLRSKHAEAFRHDPDPRLAAVAGGILQHLRDDARFHATRAFAETSLELTARVRNILGGGKGDRHRLPERPDQPSVGARCFAQTEPVPFSAAFLGHLLVELLLDAALIADDPGRLSAYYHALGEVDAGQVEAAVNRMSPRPTRRLAIFIGHFHRERILCDYLEDDKLMVRLNQVMRRVRLARLPDELAALLPAARKLVTERKDALLEGIPA